MCITVSFGSPPRRCSAAPKMISATPRENKRALRLATSNWGNLPPERVRNATSESRPSKGRSTWSGLKGSIPPSAEPSPLSLKTQAKTPQRNSIALNPCRTNSRWRRTASGNGGRRGTFGISTMDGSLMRSLSDIPPRPPRDIFRYRNARWRSRGDCTRGPPPGRPATPPRHG